MKRVGKATYRLELSVELAGMHLVFHISFLKRFVGDPTSTVLLESVAMKDSLSYEEYKLNFLTVRLED